MCFFISNVHTVISDSDINLSGIPSECRRRLSKIDKTTLSLLCKDQNERFDEIVFSSIFGELERLKNIIKQYQTYNEVSPINFSASVHNYPIGYFCRIKKTNKPYNALSSNENSISTGLVKSVISENNSVLFCYADYTEKPRGVACIISKEGHGLECTMEQSIQPAPGDEFENFYNFLKGGDEFKSALCTIKRAGL